VVGARDDGGTGMGLRSGAAAGSSSGLRPGRHLKPTAAGSGETAPT